MKTLDLQTFPLDGLALIEASAGTGKTYTLANLYLRYLLEKRHSVEQILVVTFTEAATQELKDRIRKRIGELIEVFLSAGDTQDPDLAALFEKSEQKEADLIRLRLAERQIDQAEIYTIHGFCQRMLSEYALDSNLALQQTLVEDMQPLILQHIQDFWRTKVMKLPAEQVAYLYQNWAGPEGLQLSLQPIMNRQPERILPVVKGSLDDWQKDFENSKQWLIKLKQETLDVWQDVYDLILNASIKRVNDKLKWLGQIREWAESQYIDFTMPGTSSKPNLFEEFTPLALEGHTKAKQAVPEHAYFEFLNHHLANKPSDLQHAFLVHAYRTMSEQLDEHKKQQGLLSFDDLILRLAQAIEIQSVEKTPSAFQLIQRIRQRYELALIDEFQDTDKSQYGIFSTLFGPLAGEQAKGLVLIGDPKQAIYAFRGGDIATYLLAKREVELHPKGEIFTMATNWRSAPSMIEAVNHVFEGTNKPFMADAIPFVSVASGKASEEQALSSALHVTQLDVLSKQDEKLKKEQMAMGLANLCTGQVCDLLAGQTYESSDIAILVRSASEAELIKQCLSEAGIVASFEGKASIYDSEEALALLWLLTAVAEPNNEGLIRRCLAEPFFGFNDESFEKLNRDVIFLDETFQTFQILHDLWLNKGVLATIREAMQRLSVFAHWQSLGLDNASNTWERRLSNINQLGEILQQKARVYRSPMALLRWLREKIYQGHAADDESRLRLESDEKLVRIVTIHKSKGLEYPVVFLPFLFSTRGASDAWFYDEQGRLSLDLDKSDASLVKAEQERLAEDMRLLYVALTRAKYQCFIGTCAYQSRSAMSLGLAQTAWGYLCFQGETSLKLDDGALHKALSKFSAASQSISVARVKLDDIDVNPQFSAPVSDNQLHRDLKANTLQRGLHSPWKVTSFTGLMHEHHVLHSAQHHELIPPKANRAQYDRNAIHILNFPKGSRAGTFLHTLFEHVEFATGELLADLQTVYPDIQAYITKQLEISQLVEEEKVEAWSAYLADWLVSVLKAPLNRGFTLADLPQSDYVSEMTFHFSVESLGAEGLNKAIHQYGENPKIDALNFNEFSGHMKGAIDLVFRANGQYFVLDYKSNYLGDEAEDYRRENLALAIEDHRYDVQYLLYTLALHRYLKHRLGDAYDYERDMGGVFYMFLRGLGLQSEDQIIEAPGIYFVKPSFDLIAALDKEVARV